MLYCTGIINLFAGKHMISYGPTLRRKSFAKIDPVLPKPMAREPSTKGRTVYKQLRAPSEELRDFQKKQLLTNGNLSTDKSTSHINSQQLYTMKQSRYDYDHHNTDSIAQLFEAKNEPHVQPFNSKRTSIVNSDVPPVSVSEQKMSMQSENVTVREEEKGEGGEREEEQGKEGENYDDYVLGDRVEQEQAEQKIDKTAKKYSIDHSLKVSNRYACASESEFRLERQMLLNERRKLNQINEDREIAAILQQYKNNKQQILAQTSRKNETARIMANLNHHNNNKIEKSVSLPLLKPKKEMIVPEDYYQEKPAEPWKNTKNLLAKSLERRSGTEARLKGTLSYGKLGFGRKKTRTICEQQILQQQMTNLQQIKQKLRSKGIRFDANRLKKGLVNLKNEPSPFAALECPEKRLPSNPIYKKFPL